MYNIYMKNCIFWVFFLFALLGCSILKVPKIFNTPKEKRPKRILLIGNSYVYLENFKYSKKHVLNNSPEILQLILGNRYYVDYCAGRGFSFKKHFDSKICFEKMKDERWDIVIFQEDTREMMRDYRESSRYLGELVNRTLGAKHFVMQNWNSPLYPFDYPRIRQRSIVLGQDYKTKHIPVGETFETLKEDFSFLSDDKMHPSVLGIYASAYTIAKFIEPTLNLPGDSPGNYELDLQVSNKLIVIEDNHQIFGDTHSDIVTPSILSKMRQLINQKVFNKKAQIIYK